MNRPFTILADENIPALDTCFAEFGQLRSKSGRAISAADLRDVDVLLVRSVTRVDEALLGGSRVRFVGSATIGVDHVDLDYLQRRNIQFAHAPGSNARSVVEYVLAALAQVRPDFFTAKKSRIAVIGYGNVGSRLARLAKKLGHDVYVCDPFVTPVDGLVWCDLEEALRCEIVSLHVPLTNSGLEKTAGLLNRDTLRLRPAGGVLINTSRGSVVDNQALKNALAAGLNQTVVLDVWENEPAIDPDLIPYVALATPHIAGYAADGKVRGTLMLRKALLGFLQLADGDFRSASDCDEHAYSRLPAVSLSFTAGDSVASLILKAYPIGSDDRRLRSAILPSVSSDERAVVFDKLRRDYPVRREWQRLRLTTRALGDSERRLLAVLGFALSDE